MAPAPPNRRDIVVRISRSVRFARLQEGPVADAIWAQLPYYGIAERFADGQLCCALALPLMPLMPLLPATAASAAPVLDHRDLGYAISSQRVVFGSSPAPAPEAGQATPPAADVVLWARFIEPYPPYVLSAVAHGARLSLLHADS